MGSGGDFESGPRGRRDFAARAREAGVRRIVYLGGLGDGDDALARTSASRHETGASARLGRPGVEFRASIVLGSGSLSFELSARWSSGCR